MAISSRPSPMPKTSAPKMRVPYEGANAGQSNDSAQIGPDDTQTARLDHRSHMRPATGMEISAPNETNSSAVPSRDAPSPSRSSRAGSPAAHIPTTRPHRPK